MSNKDNTNDVIDPLMVRNFVPSDLPYIMSTWLRELRGSSNSPLPDDIWFDAHRKYIDKIFSNANVVVKILAASDNPSEIVGYCIAIPGDILFWIHIRKGLRNRGLANRLLTQVGITSHLPPLVPWLTQLGRNKLVVKLRPRLFRNP